jgi:hypothetical protein
MTTAGELQLQLMTTGRGLMAGRPSASGWLVCARELAWGAYDH